MPIPTSQQRLGAAGSGTVSISQRSFWKRLTSPSHRVKRSEHASTFGFPMPLRWNSLTKVSNASTSSREAFELLLSRLYLPNLPRQRRNADRVDFLPEGSSPAFLF